MAPDPSLPAHLCLRSGAGRPGERRRPGRRDNLKVSWPGRSPSASLRDASRSSQQLGALPVVCLKMHPTPYSELNRVLAGPVSGIERHLGRNFIGTYLQGSFALGDFDEHIDVDFIVAMESELSTEEVRALQVMHDQLLDSGSEWARHLEGSYFPGNILWEKSEDPQDLWYLDNGARVLVRSDHCNSILVHWVVRESGVTLAGTPPRTLVNTIVRLD